MAPYLLGRRWADDDRPISDSSNTYNSIKQTVTTPFTDEKIEIQVVPSHFSN